jgi:outer membrane beta-barrel protein
MRRVTAALTLALALTAAARPALAQDSEDTEGLRALAVQERHHHHWHELGFQVGLLPLDSFIKGFTLTGSYTLHFDHLLAWEIVRAYGVVAEIESGLQDDLENLGISPTPFEYVEWAATSSFVFTPFYGKLAVINRALIFVEAFLIVGAGYGWLTNSQNVIVDAGGGFRVFFGEYFSIRFDCRWEGYFSHFGVPHNELSIGLGVSVHLG